MTSADLSVVSALSIASKQSWGYPPEQMRVFAAELTLSTAALVERLVAEVACRGDESVGYYTLRQHEGGKVELEHLFVASDCFRQGIGRQLLQRARAVAGGQGIETLLIIADPNSARFYERYGARKTGDHRSSIPGRTIPIYEIATAS